MLKSSRTVTIFVLEIMKKFVTLILAFFYLSGSIGVTISMHYCMKKLTGSGLNNQELNSCARCGIGKSNTNGKGCCKNKVLYFKLCEDQKIAESSILLTQQIAVIASVYPIVFSTNFLTSITSKKLQGDLPRKKHDVPIYILTCNYRI